jgi:hypothetical protein
MNVVFLSPNFPPDYYRFCEALRDVGVNVLGLGDVPAERIAPELSGALTEYYAVDNMDSYDQLMRACGYFTHQYGKIDRIESLNEYWLDFEAQLRTDFNVPGIKADRIDRYILKSQMKEVFRQAGVDAPRGGLVESLEQALRLGEETGYPAILKPDRGVGAADTYRINTPEDLEAFFRDMPVGDFLMEEFVAGTVCSYDGLCDRDGNIVFYACLVYSQGMMETVTEDRDLFYYSLKKIPADLEEAGEKSVRAFDLREKFFHIDFIRDKTDGRCTALEVNIRPPAGLTLEMFNYANNVDLYREWANVLVRNEFKARPSRNFYCGYVGRRANHDYTYDHETLLTTYASLIVQHENIHSDFGPTLGDYGYLARSRDLEELIELARFALKRGAPED